MLRRTCFDLRALPDMLKFSERFESWFAGFDLRALPDMLKFSAPRHRR